MENKQIYIDCIENGGVLYHKSGCQLEFSEGVFTVNSDSHSTPARDVIPSGWSKTESLKRFDVVWFEEEDIVIQAVMYSQNQHFYSMPNGTIQIGDQHDRKLSKCKQSEIHPIVAKFRERCMTELTAE